MRLRTLVTSFILAALGCAPELVSAQQPGQLTRVAPTTGLADSSLFICSDSTKALTRACKFSDVQKRLAFKTFDSLVTTTLRATGAITVSSCVGCGGGVTYPLAATNGSAAAPSIAFANSTGLGLYRFGADTLGIASGGVASLGIRGGASPTIFGGAGSMTIQAGTGASRTLTLQTTTAASAVKNTLILGADTSTTLLGDLVINGQTRMVNNGTTTTPALRWGCCSGTGFSHAGTSTDTVVLGIAAGLIRFASIGAGGVNLTVSNFSNATPLSLTSANSSGTLTTFLTGSGDTLKFAGHGFGALNFTAASGTPGTVCYITATGELTKNAATSCVVSSIRFKTNVKPLALDSAREIVRRLTPVTYDMKDGGRHSLHVIAEQADSISKRLSFYDDKGRVNSVDDGAILSALLRVVQDQQRQLDSIKAVMRGKKP